MKYPSEQHVKTVNAALKEAGMTKYGMMKFATRYLPRVIHEGEQIKGVVYGRYGRDAKIGGFEGMLVATNLRVLFVDHKPGYTSVDEVAYDSVSGVETSYAGIFTALTLHTKIGNFTIRYANKKCVNKFVDYVESRRLETTRQPAYQGSYQASTKPVQNEKKLDKPTLDFLKSHDVGVVSTLSRTGVISGATVYYVVGQSGLLYLLTKEGTQKARNILTNQQIALTVYDADKLQTTQIQGVAEIEEDQIIRNEVFEAMMSRHKYQGKDYSAPVTTIKEGSYMVIRITPTYSQFTDFASRLKNGSAIPF